MTLLDVFRLVRHFWKLSLGIVAVCVVACSCVSVAKNSLAAQEYSAAAVVTVSEPTGTVSADELLPIIQALGANVVAQNEDDEVSIDQELDLAKRTVTFSAVAATEDASIEAANKAARQTVEEAVLVLQEMSNRYQLAFETQNLSSANEAGEPASYVFERDYETALENVSFTVNDASQAVANNGQSSLITFGLVGLLGGIFLAICVVALIDLARKPVKGREDVERVFSAPVLAEGSGIEIGKKLWANIRLKIGDAPTGRICLIPGGDTPVLETRDWLIAAIEQGEGTTEDFMEVVAAPPFTTSVDAAFLAQESDIAIVVVEQWNDSLNQLFEAERELALAQTKLLGTVLVLK